VLFMLAFHTNASMSSTKHRYTAPDDWVFPSETGKTPIWANNVWYDHIRPTLSKAGLGWVNYQVLRRSAVTLLNALGADSTIVAAQMGHTVDVSTNIYNKIGIQRQQNAIQQLDNALQTKNHAA
jgi:integrase